MQDKCKRWLLITSMLFVFVSIGIIAINFINDPLLCFNYPNQFNTKRILFNERQQKVNYALHNKFDYDSLLIGSSRVAVINPDDFIGLNAYNFSAAGMTPMEFNDFIEFAKKVNGRDFKYIIIGLDFLGTNENYYNRATVKPQHYIEAAEDPLYRFKTLLSIRTLSFSLKNLSAQRKEPVRPLAERNAEPVSGKFSSFENQADFIPHLLTFDNDYNKYKYDENYKKYLTQLKNNNPNTVFLVFTTPPSQPMIQIVIDHGLVKDYQRWLKETVDVFGSVYHFATFNTITRNPRYYTDVSHFHPYIGTLIAHRIINVASPPIPDDFGILLTPETDFNLLKP